MKTYPTFIRTLKEDGASTPSGKDSWCYFILNCGAKHVCDFVTRSGRDTTILNKRHVHAFNCYYSKWDLLLIICAGNCMMNIVNSFKRRLLLTGGSDVTD